MEINQLATVIIGADICPIGANGPLFQNGSSEALFNDLLPELHAADLAIGNLECPLINAPSPAVKTGPVFGEPPACINGIANAGFDLLCLANNHILDHGARGLQTTIETCQENGISIVGAGKNVFEACRIFISPLSNGVRLGVIAMAEHEFSIAKKDDWGANPLDLVNFLRTISAHKKDYDFLVILLHGSHEFLVPTPRIQKTCRFMIEAGANVVVVQHPHCLGGWEEYEGGHIVYGQGALIMDEEIYRDSKPFHEGFLIRLSIRTDATAKMEIIPFVQSFPEPGARRLKGHEENEFRHELARKSRQVKDEGEVLRMWNTFCDTYKHAYLNALLAQNKVLRKLNSRGFLNKFLYARQSLLGVRNLVSCETHREAIETIFKDLA